MGVRVRQKAKGKGNPWWVFISHNGQRSSRKVGDKKAAEAVASELRAKIKLGDFNLEEQKPVPTFGEYAKSWINITVPATCKEGTVDDYKSMLEKHVLPVFGDLRITDITRGTVKTFLLEQLNSGLSSSTVKHHRNCLSGVFNLAIDDEILLANPAKQLGKGFLKTKDSKADINPLTPEELTKLLETASEHYPENFTLFLLLARTGMRIGEALALKWSDLDFDNRFIEVERSYRRGRVTTPKNDKTRKVDMSLQLAEALKAHKRGFVLGQDSQFIFTDTKGGMFDVSNWRARVFTKALAKSGVRRIRIHDLRHTYATLRISKGDNVADVSKQLGHHSVKLTWDVYYHWVPGKKKSEVDELDDQTLTLPKAPEVSDAEKITAVNGGS